MAIKGGDLIHIGNQILIDRAIDDAIAVLPLAVQGDFNEAMKRLHTSRDS